MNKKIKNTLPSSNQGRLISSLIFGLCILGQGMQPAQAEGSRTLYPSTATGNRANLEWSTDLWGGLIRRRTILKVYAEKDEYILLGSSAVRVSNGDILVFKPGNNVTGMIGSENIPSTADFKCSDQTGQGFISSRTQELAGPQSISGTGNTTGYTPCYYQAPSTGIYDIVFYGPIGGNSPTITSPLPSGQINIGTSSSSSSISNFNANQGSTVAAWDVTIRSSDQNSTTDLNGRLFSYYLSLFTGLNGRTLNFSVYPVTIDGYRYKIDLRGTDPDGFVIYGSQVGFYDSDGKTPLYHDILAQQSVLTNREGDTSLSRPQFPTFFNSPNTNVLPYIDRYRADGTFDSTGIPLTPTPPTVDSLNFTGTVTGSTSSLGTGGNFTFNSNVTGNYQIVISRDGSNFDPTNSQNRVLRGVMNTAGGQSVTWNGKDNSGDNFPVGTNYPVRVTVHAGEYHFPLLDAENNFSGGPTITLLNATNPLGNTTAFYDDRGYTTIGGTNVGTPGTVLCGTGQPNPVFSNPISGFDSASNNRKFGQSGNNGNTGTKCTGSFGDTKGLDLWTYFPSNAAQTPLNIVDSGVTISGTIYEDVDRGNDFDTGEPTLTAGINVKLIRTSDNSVVTVTATRSDGTYTFTGVANGSYTIQVDTSNSNIPDVMSLGTPNNLAVTVSGSPVLNQNFGFDTLYKVSPQVGKVIINEVLYNETSNGNDEFIELYNASSSPADLSGLKLIDGNLIASDTDNAGGFSYTFPNGTTLQPGKYAVIWIGSNNANTQATAAAFQAWLGLSSNRLNNSGDDVWLYDSQNQIIDYIAYGANNGINTPPPSSLNIWDSAYQSSLAGASAAQSISLTRNGNDTNTSACWERTTSGHSSSRCPSYLPTRDTDSIGTRITSVGVNNNGSHAKLLLVKRITRINSNNLTDIVDGQSNVATSANNYVPSPYDVDDNDGKWPTNYLQGQINAGAVKPGDELEYTIYFLSQGLSSASNVKFCDLVPANTTFIATAFNGQTPNDGGSAGDQGIALAVGSATPTVYFSNVADSDRGSFYPANDPSTPANCGSNTNGAVVVNITKDSVLPNLPAATGRGTPANSYGFVRFRAKVK